MKQHSLTLQVSVVQMLIASHKVYLQFMLILPIYRVSSQALPWTKHNRVSKKSWAKGKITHIHKIIEWLRLEKAHKIIQSNHSPSPMVHVKLNHLPRPYEYSVGKDRQFRITGPLKKKKKCHLRQMWYIIFLLSLFIYWLQG